MRLARAFKQKQAHPVLLPARPPRPAATRCPGSPVTRGAPSPGVPHRPGQVFAVGGQLCEGPLGWFSHGSCRLSLFGGCQRTG